MLGPGAFKDGGASSGKSSRADAGKHDGRGGQDSLVQSSGSFDVTTTMVSESARGRTAHSLATGATQEADGCGDVPIARRETSSSAGVKVVGV
jgi:hypothetical protein